jgi:hypothetical protein
MVHGLACLFTGIEDGLLLFTQRNIEGGIKK